jgi:hypothetical protein
MIQEDIKMSMISRKLHSGRVSNRWFPWKILMSLAILFASSLSCATFNRVDPTATIPPAPFQPTATSPRVSPAFTATLPIIEATETIALSPTDPPFPAESTGTCGNGVCDPFENSGNCPGDCPQPTQGSGSASSAALTIVNEIELPGTFYNGNDRQTPAVALSHDGQLVVNVQQPGQSGIAGEGRLYNIQTGTTTVFWKDRLISTGATWLFADPYLLRVSKNTSRGIIVTFPVYFAESDGSQFLPERGHQLLAVVPGGQSAEASLSGGNNDFYDPYEIITTWDPQVTAVGWISALDMSGDGEVIYAVAPYVKDGKNHVALIQIVVYSGIGEVLEWQVEGAIAYPFGMITTSDHGRSIALKGMARGGGMGMWIFTSDYVSQWGCYALGDKLSGINAEPATTYEHVSSGPSYFYTTGGPVILGEGDYPWVNIQYAPSEPITQLSWKEGDNRIYTFSGGDLAPITLQGRWASYDGNHAVYQTSSGLVWYDLAHDTPYLMDVSYDIPYGPESYNNYLSVDATTILLLQSDGDRSNWRLVVVQVAHP